jgi:hypothetical protein
MIENLENEVWKDVVGYEGYYQVSSQGRVKSLDRKLILEYKWGKKTLHYKEKLRKISISTNGYYSVGLQTGLCKHSHFLLHRLMAIAFLPNPENKAYVNHINGIKLCIELENLEWVNGSENALHSIQKLGNKGFHENYITENDVFKVRLLREKRYTYKRISHITNIKIATIQSICTRRTWNKLH